MFNEKNYKNILKALFFLALISPLVVDRRLFFPYVTGMALYFRVIAELLLALWVIFILIYPKYRPRVNFLSISIGLYLIVLTLATIFSSNPYLSFWGDAERMLGLFGTLHFFVLFLTGASLFRDKKELRNLIVVFTGVSLIAAVYGILQRFGLTSIKPGETRIMATMGNASVFAAYLIFGLFFSAYLSAVDFRKNWRFIFAGAGLIHVIALFLTGTRGAYLGVMAGVFLSLMLIIFTAKDKKIKKIISISLTSLVIIYALLFLGQNFGWLKGNKYIYRLTHFSLSDETVITRFMSWSWGLKGFKEKPILGYGFENFAIPYNKYFEARYYNYDPHNEYFDRAHNIVVEHLVSTGAAGLIFYLLVLGAIAYCLRKIYKRDNDYLFISIFSGLTAAYFVQNLFIFDMLPALIGFMVFLVFINNNYKHDNENQAKEGVSVNSYFVLLAAVILLIALFYSYKNLIINPYKSLKDNIYSQILIDRNHDLGMKYLRESVSHNTVLDLDLRTTAANTIFNYYVSSGIAKERKKEDLDFAISLYKKNLEHLPDDMYYNYKIGEIINYRFSVDLDEKYIGEARQYVDKAISLSPNRPRIYYMLTTNQLMEGKIDDAIKIAEYAVSLNDKFGESYWELTKTYYIAMKKEKAKENLIKTINFGYRISEDNLLIFEPLFKTRESVKSQIEFLELIVKNGTKNYLYPSTLAGLYLQIGEKEKAIEYANRSAEMNPSAKEKVDNFIKDINESR